MNKKTDQRPTKFRTRRGVLIQRLAKKYKGETIYAEAWTLRKVFEGKQYYFTLSPDRREAEKQANEITDFLRVRSHTIQEALEQFAPEKLRRRERKKRIPSVFEMLEAHQRAERLLELSAKTGGGYRGALVSAIHRVTAHRTGKKVSARVAWKDDKTLRVPVTELDRDFAEDLKLSFLQNAKNKEEEHRAKRNANAVLSNIRPIFSDAAREVYDFELPDMSSLLSAKGWRRVGKQAYRLPDMETIRKIVAPDALEELKRESRNAYLAFLLAFCAGLRAKEIANARRSWINGKQVFVTMEGDFETKAKRDRTVEVQPWAAAEILAASESPDYLLSGGKSDRYATMLRTLNKWLRARGLDRFQPTHELRKLFGAYVTNTKDIYTAQKYLGHSTPQITNDTYADIFLDDSIKDFWEKAPEERRAVVGA